MQFVKGGPEIPERLLQAHEDGRVVFFCGAGISYPAGLPDFDGLVNKLYKNLVVEPNSEQQVAIEAGQFDIAIGLLEANIVGGREKVRKELAKILTPNLKTPNATATHEALLTLGKNRENRENREGRTQLVTTNFDRLFEEVIGTKAKDKALNIECFQAPFLPVPKSRWDGLVYLHGLLSTAPTASELARLVVSSGDFGRAYLTECWAARFVSELFRNYTVCFVGYSINDLVLRYMMDALAADRLLGESPPEMFAFGSFSKGKDKERCNEWRAKNVTPILYREYPCHTYLHETLRAWAETYHNRVPGKEDIVAKYAVTHPSASTPENNFVGRVLWALSDPSGLPARRFAQLDPAPSLDWLEPLSEEVHQHEDLDRFGVPPKAVVDDKLAFSLMCRPSPYPLAPRMCVVNTGVRGSDWDKVMRQLAHWLTRHLDDPALILWLVKHGGQLDDDMARLIERRLNELDRLKRAGNTAELARIRANAPRAIPGPLMRTLWRLMLTGRVKSSPRNFDLNHWRDRFRRDGLTPTLRLELREMLAPRISLSEPFRWPAEERETSEPRRITDLVDLDIVLSTDHVHSSLHNLARDKRWIAALPELLPDFNALLRDTLDLMRELGRADAKSDRSYIPQPSISEHEQNKKFLDWTALIDLTRDAWLEMAEQSPTQATLMAESWSNTPYPLFRRLAFFAAAQDDVIPLRHALNWLLADEHWWLWSSETKCEARRLLVSLAPRLDPAMLGELEQAVLAGPPREMYRSDIEPERWNLIMDDQIRLRLTKITEAGAVLSASAKKREEQLSVWYQKMVQAADQRDALPPRRRRELVEWLRQKPNTDFLPDDGWQKRCRDNFATSACALYALTKEHFWPEDRWRKALHAWSEEKHLKRSWRYMAPILVTAPDELLQFQPLVYNVSGWLKDISNIFGSHEAHFFTLSERILKLDIQDDEDTDTDDPVGQAMSHPVGHVTEALLRWWDRRSPEDGQGLPEELKSTFTRLCGTGIGKFLNARVLLARDVIKLFRVDRDWAIEYLLPLFDWERSREEARAAWQGFLWSLRLYYPREAHAVWEGFLWSLRLYCPLIEIEKLKSAFLNTAVHYRELGKHGQQYVSLLTFAALDRGDTFTKSELENATRALPPDADVLNDTAQALVDALESVSAGEKRANYWKNHVAPYLHDIWPKTRDKASPDISEKLGLLCVEAQEAFREAFKQLRVWLKLEPPAYPDHLVLWLHEAGLCCKFPEEALDFLSLVIVDQTRLPPSDLGDCLEAIRSASPELEVDPRFKRLKNYLRQYGQDQDQ